MDTYVNKIKREKYTYLSQKLGDFLARKFGIPHQRPSKSSLYTKEYEWALQTIITLEPLSILNA